MDVRAAFRAWALIALASAIAIPAGGAIPVDLGGGIVAGGYFGDLRHDWDAGPGGTVFIQFPCKCDLEGRLTAAMVWNNGSMRERAREEGPDLGAEPGELADAYRRTTVAASLLWRVERLAIGDVGVPYIGGGFAFHERRVDFARPSELETPGGGPTYDIRRDIAWDAGFLGTGGVRFYRTSGVFLALEATVHAIDTPSEWAYAYDAAFLLGYQIGP